MSNLFLVAIIIAVLVRVVLHYKNNRLNTNLSSLHNNNDLPKQKSIVWGIFVLWLMLVVTFIAIGLVIRGITLATFLEDFLKQPYELVIAFFVVGISEIILWRQPKKIPLPPPLPLNLHHHRLVMFACSFTMIIIAIASAQLALNHVITDYVEYSYFVLPILVVLGAMTYCNSGTVFSVNQEGILVKPSLLIRWHDIQDIALKNRGRPMLELKIFYPPNFTKNVYCDAYVREAGPRVLLAWLTHYRAAAIAEGI